MKKLYIIIIFTFCSCGISIEEIPGLYLFENKYIVDSLLLSKNLYYRRVIYNIKTKEVIYENFNSWNYSDNMLELKKFLHKTDLGNKLIKSKDSTFRSPIINTKVELTRDFLGNIVFDLDRFNYYKKR